MDKTTLSIINIIKEVIIIEIGDLIYPENKKSSEIFSQSSPYIKFLPITACIEFMGACYDELPFETSRLDKEDIVERRFNTALINLFGRRYHPYAKADNDFYFYKKLRNGMIHQLRPGQGILFTTRKESLEDKTKHLVPTTIGNHKCLILVLEDFYDDLQKAAERLIRQFESKELTNKKGDMAFISVYDLKPKLKIG